MDEFDVSTCLVGVHELGRSRVLEGIESRNSSARMVPDGDVDPAKKIIEEEGLTIEKSQFSSFDIVTVIGDFSEEGAVNDAVVVSKSCGTEAISVALFSGEPEKQKVKNLDRAFGTVVLIERDERILEFVTDLFTLFAQPMMLEADYGRINSNLRQGGIASLYRCTGDRNSLEELVRDCDSSRETLLGYVEVGAEFTLMDAEQLKALLEQSRVVTGQATFENDSGIRLTMLRRVKYE